jgi:hypothetical protein
MFSAWVVLGGVEMCLITIVVSLMFQGFLTGEVQAAIGTLDTVH